MNGTGSGLKRSRHLLDPELAPLLDRFGELTLTRETLPDIRAAMRADPSAQPAVHPALAAGEVQCRGHLIPGTAGAPDVRVLVYRPADPPGTTRPPLRPGLLRIHGGGYVLGTADSGAFADVARAVELDCVVVSVDYRLAPETVFPGAVEDCHAALAWMADPSQALGIDPARIAILGVSAGGGLAAGTCLIARDRGGVQPIMQMLTYPMLDDRTGSTTRPSAFAGEYVWTQAVNRFGWAALLGHPPGSVDTPAYAAPARAASLAGLPPTFIAVGALDLFVDEDIDYARRLIAAGVPTELHVYPGAVHAFDEMAEAGVSRRFSRDCSDALSRAFGRSAETASIEAA